MTMPSLRSLWITFRCTTHVKRLWSGNRCVRRQRCGPQGKHLRSSPRRSQAIGGGGRYKNRRRAFRCGFGGVSGTRGVVRLRGVEVEVELMPNVGRLMLLTVLTLLLSGGVVAGQTTQPARVTPQQQG